MKNLHAVAAVIGLSLSACMSAPSPYGTTTETASIVDGNMGLGLDLYAQAANKEDAQNVFISPASISTALAMTYAGARAETAAQMSEALHFSLPEEEFHIAMGDVLSGVQQSDSQNELKINNRVFVDEQVVVEPEFSSLMDRVYYASERRVDFRKRHDQAREIINSWVAENTKDKIQNLLLPPDIHECTRMVLVNTIYLDAKWGAPFSSERTKSETFTSWTGDETEVPMMNQTGTFKFFERASFKALELPYLNDDISLVVVLPDAEDDFEAFERTLSPSRVTNWINSLAAATPVQVRVKLPKIELEHRLELKSALEALGMLTPFSNDADFSGIADPVRNPDEPCFPPYPLRLKIEDVIHQTFLEIDEKGTEAAAASAVNTVAITSGRVQRVEPKEFFADHSFFFVIKDNTTGMILFIGRFVAP